MEPAERSLQLAKPAAVRCAGKLISGVVLQVVAFLAFAVDMALFVGTNEVTNNAQAGLVVLAGLAIGYALWVKGMTRPFSPKAHEQEVLWHAGGMLLAVLAGAPLMPVYKGWMLALGLGAWAVFVAPVALIASRKDEYSPCCFRCSIAALPCKAGRSAAAGLCSASARAPRACHESEKTIAAITNIAAVIV